MTLEMKMPEGLHGWQGFVDLPKKQIRLISPDKQFDRTFDRDEALVFALRLLQKASSLFPSAEEFGRVVNDCRRQLGQEPIIFQAAP